MSEPLIENSVSLQAVAEARKSTTDAVAADCRELSLFIGQDWAGQPALDVRDAAALVSGSARRDRDHDVAWRAHLAATEAWETERERRRASAFQEAYDAALRQGRGAPAAASAGHEVAREAVGDFERRTPPPEFNGEPTSTRWLTQATSKIKEAVR